MKVSTFTLEINFWKQYRRRCIRCLQTLVDWPITALHKWNFFRKISQNITCSKLQNRISNFLSFESLMFTLEILLRKELIYTNFRINFQINFQFERGLMKTILRYTILHIDHNPFTLLSVINRRRSSVDCWQHFATSTVARFCQRQTFDCRLLFGDDGGHTTAMIWDKLPEGSHLIF